MELVGSTFFFDWEVSLILWLQTHMGALGTAVASFVSAFGEELACVAVIGFLYWCFDKRFGRFVGLNVLVGLVLNPMIKNIFVRRRPYFDTPEIRCLKPVDKSADIYNIAAQEYSFPSGHSTNAVAVYGSVAEYAKKHALTVIAVVLTLLIGVSRFCLGVHYPTDVLCGWALGLVIIVAVPWLQRKFHNPRVFYGLLLLLGLPGFFYCKSSDYYTGYGMLVGFVLRLLQKALQKPLLRFVARESKVNRALLAASQGYLTDLTGKPKILITIGREFGSGGHEIGRLLAEKLGIAFYDRQIDRVAAQQCGMPLNKVEELNRHMEREVVRDFRETAYAMSSNALSPEEQLFVAQSSVIRQIAAGGESCVIVGRCADYVLYDDPNCFRIFVHARPDVRIKRTMAVFGLEEEEARRQVENTDRARARHYKRFTGREYGKQEYYHLGVDSGMLGTEESVEVIVDVLRRWCDVRGSHPLYALARENLPGELK